MSAQRKVLVICVPAGEAPLWVREKWVGLELPLAQAVPQPRRVLTGGGVLTGPRSIPQALLAALRGRLQTQRGFTVPVLAALQVLRDSSPEAADWWSSNCGYLCKANRCFLFRDVECQLVAQNAGIA